MGSFLTGAVPRAFAYVTELFPRCSIAICRAGRCPDGERQMVAMSRALMLARGSAAREPFRVVADPPGRGGPAVPDITNRRRV